MKNNIENIIYTDEITKILEEQQQEIETIKEDNKALETTIKTLTKKVKLQQMGLIVSVVLLAIVILITWLIK